MVTGFCLSHKYKLDSFCTNNSIGFAHRIDHNKFPGDKGGSSKPGEIFTNRINKAKSFFL
jgi:hypothetical protein